MYLSLRFNGHFPGEPGLASVYWSKGWWRWWWQLDYWSYKSCKAPVKSSPPTNQHPVILQAGCPSCRPTNSVKSLKGKNITFHGLAYTKLTWGLPTLSLTTNSSWLPWGRVAMPLISPLMPVPQWEMYISRIMFNTDEKTWQKYYPGLLRAMVTITWQKTCFWKFQLLVIRSNLEYTGRSHNHLLEPNTSTKLL